jgi:uncharacterized protein YjbJ (UPF0337 family)
LLAAVKEAYVSDKTDRAKGKAKEAFGEASGNRNLAEEGRSDQAKGNVKAAGNRLKDAFGNLFGRKR